MGRLVVAFGGNAIIRHGERPTFYNQYKNIKRAVRGISSIFEDSENGLVITHGNGPQVGEELLRGEYAEQKVPRLPLYILNAETQGFIGSMLKTAIDNELKSKRVDREVCCIITHVLVDRNDPALSHPTKPVGPLYSKKELDRELKIEDFSYVKQEGFYRMVVPSPTPIRVIEELSIDHLLQHNGIVIACGGGGIPVSKVGQRYVGVEAVVDKDITTQIVANSVKAERMFILTGADYVYTDYKKRRNAIKEAKAAKIKNIINNFEEGTMRPKIISAVRFIDGGGKAAYIGNLFKFSSIVEGRSGTVIN
jgi:carbamate kinase